MFLGNTQSLNWYSFLPSVCSYNVPTSYKLIISTLLHVSRSRRIIGSSVLPRVEDSSVHKQNGLQFTRFLYVRFRIYAGFCKFQRFPNVARFRFCHTTGCKRHGLNVNTLAIYTQVSPPPSYSLLCGPDLITGFSTR